ncbi:MAG: hypothetical protein IPL53_22960 [Ignavibacteria bacterium]|nr:hypothetical protein [Ignavibacteria bacterium]
MSSIWELNHRKRLYKALNKRLMGWSNVIFVESPLSLLYHTFFKFSERVIPYFRNNTSLSEVKTFSPVIIFHQNVWKKFPFTLDLDSRLVSLQIKKFIKKNYINSKLIAWANSPFDYVYINHTNADKIIYDYYDNFSYDDSGNLNHFSDELNRKLIAVSDLIFCTAGIMYDFSKSMNNNSWYVPNGYDPVFKKINMVDLKVKGKIIGYLGNIRDWIDFELINKLAGALKENDYLFFIGPVENNISGQISRLKENKQFRHVPAVEYSEIYNYIKAFDVGIIPFKINKFTEGVFPNKFFEYIAADITIVSTALPDLEQFKSIINVAVNNDEFVDLCVNKTAKLKKI